MRKALCLLWLLLPLLSGCGYHLAGSGEGEGAVPDDVQTLSLQAAGAEAQQLLPLLRRQIERGASGYALVDNDTVVAAESHARLMLQSVSEHFVPSAYDATGVALQYRLTLTVTLQLYRQGALIWSSGAMRVSGDVYVSGGPASIEASRQRLLRELRSEWARQAWSRLRSGF